MNRVAAYWASLKDSKRTCITTEELCKYEWSWRWKDQRGNDWSDHDPWWSGRPAAVRRYSPDGTTDVNRWRFIPVACGQKIEVGSCVRHSRGDHDLPTCFLSRWPKNWGWIMQNCHRLYCSFPLPPRNSEPALEDNGEICSRVTMETYREGAPRPNMADPVSEDFADGNEHAWG